MRAEKAVKPKYIFVTGGVVSSLGKGLAAASIGALMEARGLKITMLKLDPYINVDPGTMNPFQHGGSSPPAPARRTTAPPARSTTPSSPRSAAATTSAARCR